MEAIGYKFLFPCRSKIARQLAAGELQIGTGGAMQWYLLIILIYVLVLMGFNIIRSKRVKSHDDFALAGRSLSIRVMVFTLICTWIGSGTFIAGAEYAYKAGFSSIWMPAGG